jgi:hypothetical protein
MAEKAELENKMMRKVQRFLPSTLAFLLFSSCANHHFRVPANGPPANAPRYVELLREKQVANLHFPTGLYSFYALDDKGFYYRSSRAIVQRTANSSVLRKGGIFISNRNRKKVRGYVFLAGSITHVGDLSRVPHEFR